MQTLAEQYLLEVLFLFDFLILKKHLFIRKLIFKEDFVDFTKCSRNADFCYESRNEVYQTIAFAMTCSRKIKPVESKDVV